MLVIIAALFVISCVNAFTETKYLFRNNIDTSGVKINLEQTAQQKLVMPGEHVGYIPSIENLGEDCYVRIAIDFRDGKLGNLDKCWIKQGEYYYLNKVLKHSDRIDFVNELIISQSINPNSTIKVNVRADAIQADNFQPDFSRLSPWGTVEVQESKISGTIATGEARRSELSELVYYENKTLECAAEDLFDGFGKLMPGGIYDGILPIRNKSNHKINVYFKTSSDQSKLLETTKLNLTIGGNLVYEGNLMSKELENEILLATIDKSDCINLKYHVELPASAANDYMELTDSVEWIFIMEDVAGNNSVVKTPKTGDNSLDSLIEALALCTLMAIIIVLLLFKRKKL